MKPVVYALFALFLYATQNVVIEQKLAKFEVSSVLIYFYIIMLPLAVIRLAQLKLSGQVVTPSGTAILIALIVGVVYFFADYFFLGAYNAGGSLMTVSTIIIMFPIFASIIKYLWVGGLPNMYQVTGYILAMFAIIFVIKGSQ